MKEVQLQQIESLLASSEEINSMLEDGDLINATDMAYFRMTPDSSPNELHSALDLDGCIHSGVIALPVECIPPVDTLLDLRLRPINIEAKRLFHSLFVERFSVSGILRLGNNECTAVIEIKKLPNGNLKIKLSNSMLDETKMFNFDTVEEVFEEFMFSFYRFLTVREYASLLQEYKLIEVERRSRTNILNNQNLLKVV